MSRKIFNPSVPKEWGVNGEAIAGGDMFGCTKITVQYVPFHLRLYSRCPYRLRSLKVKENIYFYVLFTSYLALLIVCSTFTFSYVLLNCYLIVTYIFHHS